VCHIIDELLNIELYRRDYQFSMPKFPADNGDEDEDEDEMNFHGTQELNGIFIKELGPSQFGQTPGKRRVT
jgi:hypothetical protein